MKHEIVNTEEWHQHYVAENMRAHDVEEVYLQSRLKPYDGLRITCLCSPYKKTALIEGEPVAIFGASANSLLSGKGMPWILCTDQVCRYPQTYLRHSRQWVKRMSEYFPTLENYVNVNNKFTIKWLKWCGFDILEPIEYGPFKKPFHPFKLETGL